MYRPKHVGYLITRVVLMFPGSELEEVRTVTARVPCLPTEAEVRQAFATKLNVAPEAIIVCA